MAGLVLRWNLVQRVIWALLLMLALFTWLALLAMVHNIETMAKQPGVVLALSHSLHWSTSIFAGLMIGFLLLGWRLRAEQWGAACYPSAPAWQRLLVILSMFLAWLLWRVSLGFIALPAS